jgi:squalene-hopene/tetraprenyl-beta-curcumene cyclase
MSSRRQQTAEAASSAAGDAADRAARALSAMRNFEGWWPVAPLADPDMRELDAAVRAYIDSKQQGVPDERLGRRIVAQGGLHAASPELKLELAFRGLYPRALCTAVLDPERLPVWSRRAVLSLSILHTLEVTQPAGFQLDELIAENAPPARSGFSVPFLRKRAARRAGEWLTKNGRAFPSPYSALALEALGLPPVGEDAVYLPVKETALAARALEANAATREWLLKLRRGGWHSGRATEAHPDADTTAAVLLAIADSPPDAAEWLLARQAGDGGWPAFDERTEVSQPDTTGHVLEALQACSATGEEARLAKAVEFLFHAQEGDGSWAGSHGVHYIHGTYRALSGLKAAGVGDREAPVLRAGEWLRSVQNADGGWGESCASCADGSFAAAPSTPSQTAWAVLGLQAGGDTTSLSVQQGIDYLLQTQRDDGTWDEHAATAAGIPRGAFHISPLYRIGFPLLALSSVATRGMR